MLHDHGLEKTASGLHTFLIGEIKMCGAIDNILDVGCGTGAWLNRLSKEGYKNLEGIDIDTTQFSCKSAIVTEMNLDNDLDPLGARKFEFITAIELIEHLDNPGRLIEMVSRHISDNGHFLLTTPNIFSIQSRLKFFLTGRMKFFDSNSDPTHLMPVLLNSLPKVLARHSLIIEKKINYPPDGSSRLTSPVVMFFSKFLSLFLNNDNPGDILCFVIRKQDDRVL